MKLKPLEAREIFEFASADNIFKVMPDHQTMFIEKRIRERIRVRWIAPKDDKIAHELFPTNKESFREIKFIDNKTYPFYIETMIYDTNLALISLTGKPAGIIFESKAISDSFRSLFNFVWDLSPVAKS